MQSIACCSQNQQCPHHGSPTLNSPHPTTTLLKLSKESPDQSSKADGYHDESRTPNKKEKVSEEVPSSLSSKKKESTTAAAADEKVRSLLLEEAGYDIESPSCQKRQNYLNWDDFFFGVAVLSSRRSKNPIDAYGACIVDSDNRVLGIGYDGLPMGCPDNCIPYNNQKETGSNTIPFLHTQNPFLVRAEINAILNKCSADVAGCRMYVERFPCNECAKVIIQSRIKEVIYLKDEEPDKDIYKASRILFTMAGVKTTHYNPLVSSIDLEFVSALAPTTKDAACCAEVEDKEVQQDVSNSNTDGSAEDTSSSSGSTTNNSKERFRDLMIREAGYDPVTTPSSYRTSYIGWDDYFMAMAFLTAKRSKDPNTQVGAVIVHSETKRILALGYNGFPRGCSDDCLPWSRTGDSELHKKYVYVCHAEVNAVLNKGSADVKGSTLYVALFPCNECCKIIIQAGIAEVVYMSDQYHDTDSCRASRIMFQMAGVRLRKHIPSFQSLHLNLKEPKDNDDHDEVEEGEEENAPPTGN